MPWEAPWSRTRVTLPAYSELYSQVMSSVSPALRTWLLVGTVMLSKPSVCAKAEPRRVARATMEEMVNFILAAKVVLGNLVCR